MPRFHFHTKDGQCLTDEDGTELADFDAARHAACKLLGEVVSDDPETFWKDEYFQVTVADDRGLILVQLELSVTKSPAAPGTWAARDGTPPPTR